jgi:hypothetical protein
MACSFHTTGSAVFCLSEVSSFTVNMVRFSLGSRGEKIGNVYNKYDTNFDAAEAHFD